MDSFPELETGSGYDYNERFRKESLDISRVDLLHTNPLRSSYPPTKEGIAMTTMDIGKEMPALFRHGKNQEAIDRFYSSTIASI